MTDGKPKISDDQVIWIRRVGWPQVLQRKLTQKELAEMFNVTPQYINDIIQGKRRKYGKVELK